MGSLGNNIAQTITSREAIYCHDVADHEIYDWNGRTWTDSVAELLDKTSLVH
jgi:uncharacterized protein involved in tolerance to divalent cations